MISFFPKTIPSNTTLLGHDFTEPWPSDLQSRFDLVHQRFALAGARSASMEKSVKLLTTLLKPGGWIQLGENDLLDKATDGNGARGLHRALAAVMEAGGSGSQQGIPGTMIRWLREAGLEDVKEVLLDIPAGNKCKNVEMARISTEAMKMLAVAITQAIKSLGGNMSDESLNAMQESLSKELEGEGSCMHMIIAIGRKPAR